ncbi:MAG: hypothetical protein AB1540_13710 [Bdellovibrionota bacterium]
MKISGDFEGNDAMNAGDLGSPDHPRGDFQRFPTFSPDGRFLVFASNRTSENPHELQIFLVERQD